MISTTANTSVGCMIEIIMICLLEIIHAILTSYLDNRKNLCKYNPHSPKSTEEFLLPRMSVEAAEK